MNERDTKKLDTLLLLGFFKDGLEKRFKDGDIPHRFIVKVDFRNSPSIDLDINELYSAIAVDKLSIGVVGLVKDTYDEIDSSCNTYSSVETIGKLEEIYIRDEKINKQNQEIRLLNKVIQDLSFRLAYERFLKSAYARPKTKKMLEAEADKIQEDCFKAARWILGMENKDDDN